MRPPSAEYHVAVLDTRPELEVIRDYISSIAFLRTLPDFSEVMRTGVVVGRESSNPIGGRFFYNVTEYNRDTHESDIKEGAEYGLDEVDAQIALSASRWVLRRMWPIARARNQRSGRTSAAREMVSFLEKRGIQEWPDTELAS